MRQRLNAENHEEQAGRAQGSGPLQPVELRRMLLGGSSQMQYSESDASLECIILQWRTMPALVVHEKRFRGTSLNMAIFVTSRCLIIERELAASVRTAQGRGSFRALT
jgi:hypothetical protein